MTSTSTHHAATHEPPVAVRAIGIVVAVTALLTLVAIAFALPAARSGPHDVPIGAAGPQAAGGQIAEMLDQKAPGAFAVTYYPSETALREAISNRDVYGGIALPAQAGTEPSILIATGASPMVAQVLSQLGAQFSQQTGTPLRTEDLAPPTTRDPRGAGVAASALPITLAGILPAIALVLALRTEIWTRLTTAIVFSVVAGVIIAALLRYVLGSVEHNFWGVSAGLTLGVAAALLFMLGLGSLFGRAGLAVGAALALLVGNPLSGLASAPELLPAGWGALGQFLPQGATATLLRSTAFFAGAGASTAVLVLMCWALAGAAMIVAAALRQQNTSAAVT
jgi:hypothetical protein